MSSPQDPLGLDAELAARLRRPVAVAWAAAVGMWAVLATVFAVLLLPLSVPAATGALVVAAALAWLARRQYRRHMAGPR